MARRAGRQTPIRCIWSQASRATSCTARWTAARSARAARSAAARRLRSIPTMRARRGIADGDIVRVFNDRGACLAGAVVTRCGVARRGQALLRRLVRSGRRRGRRAVRPRQRQRADARPRHLEARPRPELGTDLVEIERWTGRAAAGARLRAAADGGGIRLICDRDYFLELLLDETAAFWAIENNCPILRLLGVLLLGSLVAASGPSVGSR